MNREEAAAVVAGKGDATRVASLALAVLLALGATPPSVGLAATAAARDNFQDTAAASLRSDIERLVAGAGDKTPVRRPLSHTIPFLDTYFSRSHDLSGDGLDDIVQRTYERAAYHEGPAEGYEKLGLTALRGYDGKRLWMHREHADDATIEALPARVGEEGENGFYVVTSWYSESSEDWSGSRLVEQPPAPASDQGSFPRPRDTPRTTVKVSPPGLELKEPGSP